jgi:hypothetical protein
MKRALFLATAALLLMLVLAPVAMAQETTVMPEETQMPTGGDGTTVMPDEGTQPPLGETGGPAILLPAAALLLGSGVLTYAIVRRR